MGPVSVLNAGLLVLALKEDNLATSILTLSSGDSICTVLPEIGGGLGSWKIGDQNMLRGASLNAIATRDPLGLATFPLVPFSNRIRDSTFEWAGTPITLAKNFLPERHSIHGVGWQRAWSVESRSETSVTLTLEHHSDAYWPWPFEARQIVSMGLTSLHLSLSVRNLAADPVPLSFGYHPYFEAEGASLSFPAGRVWLSDADALPVDVVRPHGQFDFALPMCVEGREVDNCYAGVTGAAQITWADRRYALEIESMPLLGAAVVYIPKGGDYFCFEPVPHINNALNMPGHQPAMPIIEPGSQYGVEIAFNAMLSV
jgi:aldose 1-epimerase